MVALRDSLGDWPCLSTTNAFGLINRLSSSWPTTAASSTASWLTSAASTSDRKSTRLNSSHGYISYAVFCLKKKKKKKKECSVDVSKRIVPLRDLGVQWAAK